MGLLKPLLTAFTAVVGVVLALEVAFRLGGMWAAREPQRTADGRTVVLCVGDSHTRGRDDPENYPAQLERILNERADRPYRVVNVGVPGMNTAQVRERFERYLAYYRPAVVVHWAGINNFWNHAGRDGDVRGALARLVDASKLVRFARVALFYRGLGGNALEAPQIEGNGRIAADASFAVNFGGVEESIKGEPGEKFPLHEVEAFTRADLTAMMSTARAHGVPMFLIAYSYFAGNYYTPVNAAVRGVSEDFKVPWISAGAGIAGARREAPGEKLFDAWVHPTPILYKHIAVTVYATLVQADVVVPKATAGG